jgi:glycosyltransferase involved in cell wall biosynthesis
MKVLVCAYSCVSESGVSLVGGEASLGWNMVAQLSKFADVSVLTHYRNQKSIEAMQQKEPLERVTFLYVTLPGWLDFLEPFHKGGIQIYSYFWQIGAYFFAKKLHAEKKFDVFHHVTYANDWMASYIGALLPIPYIRGPGGGAHNIPKAFLLHYSAKEKIQERLRSFGQWCFRHDPFFVKGQNRAKKILVCNNEAFDALKLNWQRKAELFPVNGISNTDFLESRTYAGGPFTVVTAGKLIKLKQVDVAIRAFTKFHATHSASQFIIIGDGPELERLIALARELNVESSVVFKKWMPRNEVLQTIADANIFLFASLRDGGGAVVVEAMAQGKPVICFDMAGPGFHVDENCGIKIIPTHPAQAIADMAEALKKLYDDPNLQKRLGTGAKEKAMKNYTWDHLGERMQEIYETVLQHAN